MNDVEVYILIVQKHWAEGAKILRASADPADIVPRLLGSPFRRVETWRGGKLIATQYGDDPVAPTDGAGSDAPGR